MDWRVMDVYADLLFYNSEFFVTANREPPDADAGRLYEYSKELFRIGFNINPSTGVKNHLGFAKNHALLGDPGKACGMYVGYYEDEKNADRRMPLLLNNVAICKLQDATHRDASLDLMMRAKMTSKSESEFNKIQRNIMELVQWKELGYQGTYKGGLLW